MQPVVSAEENAPEHHLCLHFASVRDGLFTPEFIVSFIRSCDSNNETGGKWQLEAKAGERACGHADDNVRLCKKHVRLSTL